ncbi:GNAT family N-acetyltransferase [Phycicoccus duodecadis]|uniref:RimJ/RimL family protein N-acetyltransferase n=1 Tax=Phycicoccus duodecadis TaxID=173053 RepID=A0A2N3YLN6_9MICO|nr:GNAT family protein [Phycicoccus duodecadis]PKW27781.1 RimJ/RimL family protein N-acetyltransferase [Phycicoccus duodecadis]
MAPEPTVTLRSRTPEDLDVLFRLSTELDTWEERSARPPRPMTREAYEARLAQVTVEHGSDAVSFVVDVDGAATGIVTLLDVDHLARHAEVGITLERSFRGRGIGTAAIVLLVEFGFVRLNLRRLHLQAIASNTAAIRAYEKAGFVVEGRQRQHAWVRGGYEDIVRMGILRSEHRRA